MESNSMHLHKFINQLHLKLYLVDQSIAPNFLLSNIGSGMISIVGNAGDSQIIKYLNLGAVVYDTVSISFSNILNDFDIK